MDETAARTQLESMVAAASVPTLTTEQVDQLLDLARRSDADGRLPSDDGWEPTWALNAAAAEGWRWKAGLVAGKFDFGSDGQQFNRSDMVDACLAMAKLYGGRNAGSIPLTIPGPCLGSDLVPNVNW